jgi:hypothetical protein
LLRRYAGNFVVDQLEGVFHMTALNFVHGRLVLEGPDGLWGIGLRAG